VKARRSGGSAYDIALPARSIARAESTVNPPFQSKPRWLRPAVQAPDSGVFFASFAAGQQCPADAGVAKLTSIKAAPPPIANLALLFEGRRSMTTETILIVGAITAAFTVFALTLWRAERLTRDLKRD
jgi:hypothetical protein